jgi:hypothetical protein
MLQIYCDEPYLASLVALAMLVAATVATKANVSTDRFTLADVAGCEEARAETTDSTKADLEHLHPLPGDVV